MWARVCPFLQKQGDRGSQKFFDDCGVESWDSLIDSHPYYGAHASGCQRSFRPTWQYYKGQYYKGQASGSNQDNNFSMFLHFSEENCQFYAAFYFLRSFV